ncbi:MAG: hypothetical protein V3T73_02005 [Dehalococcoidales bacterium]
METWAIVTLVIGTSAISALLTFFITKMQVGHSDKRLEKQLERDRDVDYRQRRREVRSEPLLKLRDGLASMAARLDRLVINTKFSRNLLNPTKEEDNGVQQALEGLRKYMTSEEFLPIRYLQYDKELVKLMGGIEDDYVVLLIMNLASKELKQESKELEKESQKRKTRIPVIQELINKRLEEL